MNGAAAIHDFELAAFGGTSEDVGRGTRRRHLRDGGGDRAGDERRDLGGRAGTTGAWARDSPCTSPRRPERPGDDVSVLLACHRHDVPVTVHTAIGAEIIHQHPAADGAAMGATSQRDFLRLAGSLPDLDQGGVVLNWGSAVIMPEVFLKALTVARNLGGGKPTHFLAADFDMQRHYRPRVNVVQRPTLAGGTGIQVTGHHELMFPLLYWAVLEQLAG